MHGKCNRAAMYFGRAKSTSIDNTSLMECNNQLIRYFGLLLMCCVYLQLVVDFIVFHFYMPNVAARPCISDNTQVWIIHLRRSAKSIGRTVLYFGRVKYIRVDNASLECQLHSCGKSEWRLTNGENG